MLKHRSPKGFFLLVHVIFACVLYSYLAFKMLSIEKIIDITTFYLDNTFSVFYDRSHFLEHAQDIAAFCQK
jgi:hypothetical protein